MSTNETNLCHNGHHGVYVDLIKRTHSDNSDQMVRGRTPRWKDECYQFAQETTLHGLKYISLKDAFVFRR
jgi:hypothetical protein